MIKVKVFDEEHEDDLTVKINQFLEEKASIQLLDIKFSTAACTYEQEQYYCFSALLLYKEE